MRIACPKCGAEYEVPPAMIGGGKDVRCARCRAIWYVGAQPPPPEPAATPTFSKAVGETEAATPVSYDAPVAEIPAIAPYPAAALPEPFAPVAEVLPPPPHPTLIAATTGLIAVDWDEATANRAEGMSLADKRATAEYISDIQGGRRGIAAILAAWALSIAIVAGGLAAAYHYHASVMNYWPPSQRLYSVLGISK